MSRDLFDDSTMTFGEHLEVLRIHLWKAIIGLALGVIGALFFSQHVILWIQQPVTAAMKRHFQAKPEDSATYIEDKRNTFDRMRDWWSNTPAPGSKDKSNKVVSSDAEETPFALTIDAQELATKLKEVESQQPDPAKGDDPPKADDPPKQITINFSMQKSQLTALRHLVSEIDAQPRTDGADEAFMIYLKVSTITGIVISSPWVFYQIWLFVAAGLFPNERKYVHTYLPMSVGLFLGGALFCFFVVIPYVLDFLFSFNAWLQLRPEMKISTWITFAMTVSLMFGVSFQLPLVMLFLERISIVDVKVYREKRRLAILIISIISMVLTPSDPVSMMLMMIPLCILYELGIILCGTGTKKSPFEMSAV